MFIFDKVVEEDCKDPEAQTTIKLPDGLNVSVGPSAHDAFSIFEDLCLLANAEQPRFLKLRSLQKTFALELLESILTNYHDLFRKVSRLRVQFAPLSQHISMQHTELLIVLQHLLCPLLLKNLSDRLPFPLTLRCTRVVFILLKQFSWELHTEAEVFTNLLIRMIGQDSELPSSSSEHLPWQGGHARAQWIRVLAMEIIRG